MDRFEIIDPGSNGEAVFLEFRPKWLLNLKIAKIAMSRTKQAGSQYTLFKPLSCPKNGETLTSPILPKRATSGFSCLSPFLSLGSL